MLDSTEQPIGNIIFSRAEGVNIAMNLAGWDEKVAVLADTAAKDAVNGDTDLQKQLQKEAEELSNTQAQIDDLAEMVGV